MDRTGFLDVYDATRCHHYQARVRELTDGSIEIYEPSQQTWVPLPESRWSRVRWSIALGTADLDRANAIASEYGCYLGVARDGRIVAQVLPRYRDGRADELLSEVLHKIGRALGRETSEVLRREVQS